MEDKFNTGQTRYFDSSGTKELSEEEYLERTTNQGNTLDQKEVGDNAESPGATGSES